MPSSSSATDQDYPSMLWVTIPPLLLFSAYYIRKWYLARKLRLYGIGKGAPGFQTNVRRIRVTPEIAARIRRGEDVSPEEIARASAQAEEEEKKSAASDARPITRLDPEETQASQSHMNEWLPESLTTPKKRGKGKRK
ncbi:hypothetical protein BDZ94DRAFT_1246180 [Collybia nuda]|uniref:Uncharacterized protein n=1 Tax=Collybia nuda TaxID=64659 RepID=A0A9P5YHG8_9AGAR|nr:hypothetical protein BDZ94DRAFT_1246180 [Collybia nuda]